MYQTLRFCGLVVSVALLMGGPALACPVGYHQRGNVCVQDIHCPTGSRANSIGICTPVYKCLGGFHPGASGCIGNVSCLAGYHADGAICVRNAPGQH